MGDATIWGIHGGRTGDADTLFLKKSIIAIGWAKLGDLSMLGASREAFRTPLLRRGRKRSPARSRTTRVSCSASLTK